MIHHLLNHPSTTVSSMLELTRKVSCGERHFKMFYNLRVVDSSKTCQWERRKFGEVCKMYEFQRYPCSRANARTRWCIMVHKKAQMSGECAEIISNYWLQGPGIIYMKMDRRDRAFTFNRLALRPQIFLFFSHGIYIGIHAIHSFLIHIDGLCG